MSSKPVDPEIIYREGKWTITDLDGHLDLCHEHRFEGVVGGTAVPITKICQNDEEGRKGSWDHACNHTPPSEIVTMFRLMVM